MGCVCVCVLQHKHKHTQTHTHTHKKTQPLVVTTYFTHFIHSFTLVFISLSHYYTGLDGRTDDAKSSDCHSLLVFYLSCTSRKKKIIIESFHEQKVGVLKDCQFKSISVMLLLQVLVRDCETEVFLSCFYY